MKINIVTYCYFYIFKLLLTLTTRNCPLPKQLEQTYKCSHSHVLLRFTHNVQWSDTGATLDISELKIFSLAGPGFFSLRLDHNFVSSNWAKPSQVKFKGLLIFRAVISIISIVIYVLLCPTYYVDTWVSHTVYINHSSNHSSMKPSS